MTTLPRCSWPFASPPSALSDPGSDDQRFAPLQSITHTDIGRKEFGKATKTF